MHFGRVCLACVVAAGVFGGGFQSSVAENAVNGSRVFDEKEMGYTDDGAYVFDTAGSGNSNSGHDYGTKLSENEKRDLLKYLKAL